MIKIAKMNRCELCQKSPSEIHHILGRGELLNGERFLIELCNDCHNKHSRADILQKIFNQQVNKYGIGWLQLLLSKIKEFNLHKPKEKELAFKMIREE